MQTALVWRFLYSFRTGILACVYALVKYVRKSYTIPTKPIIITRRFALSKSAGCQFR